MEYGQGHAFGDVFNTVLVAREVDDPEPDISPAFVLFFPNPLEFRSLRNAVSSVSVGPVDDQHLTQHIGKPDLLPVCVGVRVHVIEREVGHHVVYKAAF